MRIFYVHNGSDLYGASWSLLHLVARLDRRRFDPYVLLPSDGPLAVALTAEAVPVRVMSSLLSVMTRRVIRSWRLVPSLVRLPFSVLAVVKAIRRVMLGVLVLPICTVLQFAAYVGDRVASCATTTPGYIVLARKE